jgi:NAD(P)-dependent dehydrogenase (short-subunit alcohol dehydrogenase family)
VQSFGGKTAVITGATSGIGEATARLMAERGATGILVTGRSRKRGEPIARSLGADSDVEAVFVAADLAHPTAYRQIVETADRHFGRIDILVNCAGDTSQGSIETTTPDLWEEIMAVNLRSPFFLMQETVRIMRREGNGGSIVNVGSVAAHGGPSQLAPYAASKAGLATLTRNIAYAVMTDRIRVNCLQPGWSDTPAQHLTQARYGGPEDWLAAAEAESPFGQLLKPKEIAEAIAFLASDQSGLMTGAVVDYDQSVQGAGRPPQPPPLTRASQ